MKGVGQDNVVAVIQQDLVGNERLFVLQSGQSHLHFQRVASRVIHSWIRIQLGKSQVWNRRRPHTSFGVSRAVRVRHFFCAVSSSWTGSWGKWRSKSKGSSRQDLPSLRFWFLFFFCAFPRLNYIMRMLHPCVVRECAIQHDDSNRRCFEQFWHTTISGGRWDIASMPLVMGGLGLRSLSFPLLPAQHIIDVAVSTALATTV